MKRILLLVLLWLLVLGIGIVAALLRYGLVESADVARVCDASKTLACDLRHVTVLGFITGNVGSFRIGVYGWTALAATVLALWRANLFTAWLAAATGAVAVLLYCFEPGALALLVGCLRLARLGAAPPRDEHGPGQHQVHAQP